MRGSIINLKSFYRLIIYSFRLYKMASMLVKCMLPISHVENKGFRENINYIDPSFTMPSRQRIKETALPKLKAMCTEKIKKMPKQNSLGKYKR